MARITVKLQNGQVGTIEEREYNPQAMTLVSQTQPVQQPQQVARQPQQPAMPVPVKDKSNFLQNLVDDTGENLGGLLAIPGALARVIMKPEEAPQMGKNIVSGVVDEYKNLISNPLKHGYEKPLSTVLDVLPFLQAGKLAFAGKAGGAGKAATAAKAVTGSADDIVRGAASGGADDLAKILKPPVRQSVSPSLETATNVALENFTVPRKTARWLKPKDTLQEVLQHNPKARNLDDLKYFSSQVTGKDGVVSGLSRKILSSVSDDVSVSNVLSKVQEFINKQATLKSNSDAITKEIFDFLPDNATGKAKANKIFDSIQDLEAQGYQLLNSSTDLTPNLKNEQLGQVYLEAAARLKDSLDEGVKTSNAIQQFKTPEVLSRLSEISPRLAKQYQNAKSWNDLRRIQSPFVKLSRMIDITQNSQTAPFNNLARALTRNQNIGVFNQLPFINSLIANKAAGVGQTGSLMGAQVLAGKSGLVDAAGKTAAFPFTATGKAIKNPLSYIVGREIGESNASSDDISRQEVDPTFAAPDESYVGGQVTGQVNERAQRLQKAQEFLAMKMIEDLAVGGKNVPKLQAISTILETLRDQEGGRLELSDTAVKNVNDLKGALSDILGISESIESSELTGPIRGLATLNPYADDARILQAEIDRVRQVVGKALEGGVLRKEDEEKYKKILPTMTDTKAQALSKLQKLKIKIDEDLQSYINLQSEYGKGAGLENLLSAP
jgi:hypothetical protein